MALSERRTRQVNRLKQRRTREREGAVLVEGVRGVGEALDGGASFRFVVTAPGLEATPGGADLLAALEGAGVDRETVADGELVELSDIRQPQGVLAVCEQPSLGADPIRPGARLLVLDGVQDPGNVGTLVRAAVAFGLDGVVALDGTVDPWGAKAVRASTGMAFRIPLWGSPWADVDGRLEQAGVLLLVADGGGRDVRSAAAPSGWALVVGNEGRGPRSAVVVRAADTLAIPMPGPAESLNAAMSGSILLYALTVGYAGGPA